jgi:glyoxylase-like metal-dependent hydrolase (beta-lactamase superfamily II)
MRVRYRTADHALTALTVWDPHADGERIDDHTLMSRSNSNAYLVTTSEGDIVINTGTFYQGARHRERFEALLGRELEVRRIVLTQWHDDHTGGQAAFNGPTVETIAHARLLESMRERDDMVEYFLGRTMRLMGAKIGEENLRRRMVDTIPPTLTTTFESAWSFEQGERRFELYSAPGGETLDGIVVWLPRERTVFTGNLLGALFPQTPHLSTIRGDRQRSAVAYLRDVQRLIDFEPELLVTGHGEPVRGADRIRFELTRLRDGVRYIHDETVRGMNDGKDLWTLMDEIRLPPELEVGPNRGPVSWYVRSVWEEYSGWFHFRSTTELYPVPPEAVWPDLTELAGIDALVARAREHADAGRALQALHLTEIALSAAPRSRSALETQLAALEQLMEETGGDQFDLLRWLETELERVASLLAD